MKNRNSVFEAYEKESQETKRFGFLPYYGGKNNLAKRIIRELSPTEIYVEAFGGGASVLLLRPRVAHEVYCEILPDIANIFLAMRDNGERLIWELRNIPYARAAFEEARQANGAAADAITRYSQSAFGKGDVSSWLRNHAKESTPANWRAHAQGATADKITAIQQAHNGASGQNWGHAVDVSEVGTPTVKVAARRTGAADSIAAIEQSVNSHGLSGWRRSKYASNYAYLPSNPSMSAYRQGGIVVNKASELLPYGIIIPTSGVDGIETLLSHRPMKCETLADAQGDVIALFAASRWYPLPLYRRVRDLSDDVEKAIWIARQVLREGGDIARERLYPWRGIGETWYGQVEARLKATQVETKEGDEIIEDYFHETNAVIDSPVGKERHLGRWLPIEETPLWRVRERLQGVDIRNESAMDVIAEYADNPNAMIYCDPPYHHAARKSTSDYGAGEMSDDDHAALLALCKTAKANIAISGYRNELYDRELADWRRIDWDVIASSAGGKDNKRVETLWVNYDISEWRPEQGALF